MQHILDEGIEVEDRTGVGTLSSFGYQLRFEDIEQRFPLLTTKKVHWHSIVHELLWFLSGDTNIGYLHRNRVTIWDEWADEEGDVGRLYGAQWRDWDGFIDQVQDVIEGIRYNPNSRRHLVTAWNPSDVIGVVLPPCHVLFQFYASDGDNLSLHLYQRSADVFLGLPFNIASYALMLSIIAHLTERVPKDLIISIGDAHIYKNHIKQCHTQLQRHPLDFPVVRIDYVGEDIDDIKAEHIKLIGYKSHPKIKADVAV